jgi:hypothetical protein
VAGPGQYRVCVSTAGPLVERANRSVCEYPVQSNAECRGTIFGALLSEDAGDEILFVSVAHLDLRTMFPLPVLLLLI